MPYSTPLEPDLCGGDAHTYLEAYNTLVMDVTMTHDDYGRTTQCTNGALTHRVSSIGAPQSDGALNNASRIKIRHYCQIYVDRPDPSSSSQSPCHGEHFG